MADQPDDAAAATTTARRQSLLERIEADARELSEELGEKAHVEAPPEPPATADAPDAPTAPEPPATPTTSDTAPTPGSDTAAETDEAASEGPAAPSGESATPIKSPLDELPVGTRFEKISTGYVVVIHDTGRRTPGTSFVAAVRRAFPHLG